MNTKNTLERLLLPVAWSFFFLPISSAQVTFSIFTDPHPTMSGGTIGIAFAGDKFVGSVQGDGLRILYSTDLLGGNVQPFAPTANIQSSAYFDEHAVAGSLGLGGFPNRDIYVGARNQVRHITHDGTKSDVLVGGLASDVTGLRFDAVGTFGQDLLVGTLGGQIYRVSSAGVPTLLTTIGEVVEGLDVVPIGAKFGSFDGQMIVVAERSGLIRAVDWAGKGSVLNGGSPIPLPESINFVPLNLGASGTSLEGFYQANFPQDIVKVSGSQFDGMKGDAIVSGELGSLWRMHWNGTAFEITALAPNPGQAEDGIFVTPNMIDPPLGGTCPDKHKHDSGDHEHEKDGPHT